MSSRLGCTQDMVPRLTRRFPLPAAVFDDNWGRTGASEMDVHNVEDAGLSPAEAQAMHDAWAVNTAAVGESVLKRGGFAVPYFAAMQRNVTDPVTHCQRDMQTVCKVNKTTGRPNIHDQALLLEFSEYPDSKCKLAGLVCLRARDESHQPRGRHRLQGAPTGRCRSLTKT